MSKRKSKRRRIPNPNRRRLLIEAGYCCSIPGCTVGNALDFHHIDGNPNNNDFDNLLVLCSNHHRLATEGRIDRKACVLIKKGFASQYSQSYTSNVLLPQLKSVVRAELKNAGLMGSEKKQSERMYPSIFERKYLFKILKTLLYPPRDIYLSIKVLGELRYKGSTDVIISAVEELRKKTLKRNRQKFYYDFYLPAVESLGKIGTKKAIKWMAQELLDETTDVLNKFVLLMSITGNESMARRYVGFRQLSRKSVRKGSKEITESIFRICGRKLSICISRKK